MKRKQTSSAPPILVSGSVFRAPGTPGAKCKQWTEYQIKKAKDALKSGKSGVICAASDHGIPAATLKDIRKTVSLVQAYIYMRRRNKYICERLLYIALVTV